MLAVEPRLREAALIIRLKRQHSDALRRALLAEVTAIGAVDRGTGSASPLADPLRRRVEQGMRLVEDLAIDHGDDCGTYPVTAPADELELLLKRLHAQALAELDLLEAELAAVGADSSPEGLKSSCLIRSKVASALELRYLAALLPLSAG